jgi:hypothetical protein
MKNDETKVEYEGKTCPGRLFLYFTMAYRVYYIVFNSVDNFIDFQLQQIYRAYGMENPMGGYCKLH